MNEIILFVCPNVDFFHGVKTKDEKFYFIIRVIVAGYAYDEPTAEEVVDITMDIPRPRRFIFILKPCFYCKQRGVRGITHLKVDFN